MMKKNPAPPVLVHLLRMVLVTGSTVSLLACGHTPVTRTLADAFGAGKGVEGVVLGVNFRYLKITARGRDALMVLGYTDVHPDGLIETWYSSVGEVLRLQNGRLLSTSGLETDWNRVRYFGLPSWQSVVQRNGGKFTRMRDEMPGHRFGVEDQISLYAVPPPKDAHLIGLDPRTLSWFEERTESTSSDQPSARYGIRTELGEAILIYGEQCLSATFCIAWQIWPASS